VTRGCRAAARSQGAITFRWFTGLMIAASTLAMPAAAQATGPTTLAFDGIYSGVSHEGPKFVAAGESARCAQSRGSGPLTITNGVVQYTGAYGLEWKGTVNPQGGLVMRSPRADRLDGQIDSQGTVRGQTSGIGCFGTWVWRKQSE